MGNSCCKGSKEAVRSQVTLNKKIMPPSSLINPNSENAAGCLRTSGANVIQFSSHHAPQTNQFACNSTSNSILGPHQPSSLHQQVIMENGKLRLQNPLTGSNCAAVQNSIMSEAVHPTPNSNRKVSQNPVCNVKCTNRPSGPVITLVALYTYQSRADGDLSFKKGDTMILLDDSNSDWWYVKHNSTDVQGYVPRNFVAIQESTESEEWFAGKIPRSIAEKMVMGSGLPRGAYLIRDREIEQGEYALTIKDYDDQRGDSVKHYKIKRLENGGFYITTRKTFVSLQDLVRYYSGTADGLCHVLTQPCPRRAPTRPDLSHQTQKNWEIPRCQLEFYEKIGQGNFGEVWYGKWNSEVDVAIKTLRQGAMSRQAFLEEASIMKQCLHPNLVKLFAVCTQEDPVCIVTEYMANGSLLDYLRGNEGKKLIFRAMVDMCAQIANGMFYLEKHRMVHRDLAARNILVGEKMGDIPIVKVADFGLARIITDDEYNARTGAKFPIKWTAPEAALYASFTIKSDVWSYGVLLYEIITRGQVPYPGMQNREVIDQVERGYRMPCPRDCPSPMYQIMLQTWDQGPDNRPTFEFLFHFFDDYFISAQPSYAPSDG